MKELEFGLVNAEDQLEEVNLLRVPHKDAVLVVNYPPFGDHTFRFNLDSMGRSYFHSRSLPKVSFRVPTTSESISVLHHTMYDSRIVGGRRYLPLQLGIIGENEEGVFANPPLIQGDGVLFLDLNSCQDLLSKSEEINGIYLHESGFGFAPYETFDEGDQDPERFAQGGLARLLEHTKERKARKLERISDFKLGEGSNIFGRGVRVRGFRERPPKPKVVVLLENDGIPHKDRYLWVDGSYGGQFDKSHCYGSVKLVELE